MDRFIILFETDTRAHHLIIVDFGHCRTVKNGEDILQSTICLISCYQNLL